MSWKTKIPRSALRVITCLHGGMVQHKQRLFFFGICALITVSNLSVWQAESTYSQRVSAARSQEIASAVITNNRFPSHSPRDEVRHIVFLKVHKAASSTLMNIFYRFGYRRELSFLLNAVGNNARISRPLIPGQNDTYDILANHVKHFDYKEIAAMMPTDSVYIAIVREPLGRLYSAYKYYHYDSYDEDFENYCLHPEGSHSTMAYDFGTKLSISRIQSYLSELDTIFNFVLVVEYIDESLVMMRRMLKWPMKDVVYMARNTSPDNSSIHISRAAKASVIRYLHVDYTLYDHFLAKFKLKMEMERDSFKEEVSFFKSINTRITDYCVDVLRQGLLRVAGSQWSEEFYISRVDCRFMQMESLDFIDFVREKQLKRVTTDP